MRAHKAVVFSPLAGKARFAPKAHHCPTAFVASLPRSKLFLLVLRTSCDSPAWAVKPPTLLKLVGAVAPTETLRAWFVRFSGLPRLASKARNDKREKMRKVDLCFLKTPQDSRIFDEFCALREKAQGSYLEW